ncbi:MAG: dynamin family protein [Nakamurella sp.]
MGIPTPPIAPSPHPPVPPTPPTAVAGAASVAGTLQVLADGRRLAERRHREDLVAQLDAARSRLGERTMTVALVGEFKKGKSTLVNALLQTAVCPVDADVVTVVPTMICYGETPSAIAHFEKVGQSDQPVSTAVPIESIAEFVSEIGNPGNARHLRSLEIRLPHRLLKSGLRLIDTPGVGGLDSAHGIVTLGVLDQVDGIIFVTDASAELNQPELTFLRSALERCPQAACVMTKIDLYPHWRRIRARNAAHLTAAGLDLPLIAVSSFLRLRARRRPELLTESGFTALVEFLGRSVAGRANTAATQVAAQQADFVATQLAHEVRAEQAVLVEPARAEELVEELTSARNRAAGLASPTASWQQVLTDGVQDLVADVQHDLQERLRAVLRDAEALIDRADPKDSWDDVEEWLRRQAVTAAIANYDALKEQATDLARYVAESFDLEAGQAISWESLAPPEGLQQLSLASVETLRAPGGRLGSMLMATRTAVFVPMALFGVAGSLLGAVVMVPVTLILVGGIGQKLIRDERKRQIAHRQQQARAAARRFVDEVGFIMNKETQDALRRTQRQLRDDFQQRAAAIHRSSVSALDVAARAARMTGADRRDRVAELSAQTTALSAISRTLQSAVSRG